MLNDQSKPIFEKLIRSLVRDVISDTALYRLIIEKIEHDPEFSALGCICIDDLYYMITRSMMDGVIGGLRIVTEEKHEVRLYFPATSTVDRLQVYDEITFQRSQFG